MKLLRFPGRSLQYIRDQFAAVEVINKEYLKERGDYLWESSKRDMTPEELKSRNWIKRLFNITTIKYVRPDVYAPFWRVDLHLTNGSVFSEVYYTKEEAYDVEAQIKRDVLS